MNKNKTFQKVSAALCRVLLCALCLIGPEMAVWAKGSYSVTNTEGSAVIQTDTLNVRSGPGKEYEVIGKAKAGEEFTVDGETSNGWYRIDYNGKEGYVSGDYAKITLAGDRAQEENEQEENGVPDEERAPVPGLRGVWQKIKSAGAVAVIACIMIPVVLLGIILTVRNMFQNRDEEEEYDEEDYGAEEYDAGDYEEDYEGEFSVEKPRSGFRETDSEEDLREERNREAYLSREVAPYIEEEEALQRKARELEEKQRSSQDAENDAELAQAMEKLEELQREIERIKQNRK